MNDVKFNSIAGRKCEKSYLNLSQQLHKYIKENKSELEALGQDFLDNNYTVFYNSYLPILDSLEPYIKELEYWSDICRQRSDKTEQYEASQTK